MSSWCMSLDGIFGWHNQRTTRNEKEEAPKESTQQKPIFSNAELYAMTEQLDKDQPRMKVTEFPKLTPSKAVIFLAETMEMTIDIQTGMRKDVKCQVDRLHKWRCIVSNGEGSIKVTVDSFREDVAREMACVEFLEKLRQVGKELYIPKYFVSDVLFIDPRIVTVLEREAEKRHLSLQIDKKIRSVKIEEGRQGTVYICECIVCVGEKAYRGESFSAEYAKLGAANQAFEGLTGRKMVRTKYFAGDKCDPGLEFSFGECEKRSKLD